MARGVAAAAAAEKGIRNDARREFSGHAKEGDGALEADLARVGGETLVGPGRVQVLKSLQGVKNGHYCRRCVEHLWPTN